MRQLPLWMALTIAPFLSGADQPLTDPLEPSLRRLAVNANRCLGSNSPSGSDMRRCLKFAYQGRSLENLAALHVTFLSADKSILDSLAALIAARNDKQVGSAPDTGGTTSLATTGYAPRILSLAVEQGAISRQIYKNILTFRTTPAGFLDAARKVDIEKILAPYLPGVKLNLPAGGAGAKQPLPAWMYRLSLAVSFDTNRSGQQGVLLANRQQVAGWGARALLVNQRDPSLARYTANWKDLANKQGTQYQRESERIAKRIQQEGAEELRSTIQPAFPF